MLFLLRFACICLFFGSGEAAAQKCEADEIIDMCGKLGDDAQKIISDVAKLNTFVQFVSAEKNVNAITALKTYFPAWVGNTVIGIETMVGAANVFTLLDNGKKSWEIMRSLAEKLKKQFNTVMEKESVGEVFGALGQLVRDLVISVTDLSMVKALKNAVGYFGKMLSKEALYRLSLYPLWLAVKKGMATMYRTVVQWALKKALGLILNSIAAPAGLIAWATTKMFDKAIDAWIAPYINTKCVVDAVGPGAFNLIKPPYRNLFDLTYEKYGPSTSFFPTLFGVRDRYGFGSLFKTEEL